MTKLEEIEQAVAQLSAGELARFQAWFDEHCGRVLDERLGEDITAGKLDWLAEEALADHRKGLSHRLD